jgi:hypothetical protein
MLPFSENTENVENIDDLITEFEVDEQEKTQTFALNFSKNTIGGIVDDLVALRQSIYLMLSVEADQFIIYPYTYGLMTIDLIGKPIYYVMAVLPTRIKETLLSDDRITDVTDFEFEMNKNKLMVKFLIHTIYGDDIEANTMRGNYINQSSTVEISLGEIEIALDGIIALQNSYINGTNV